jgi:hypothetical protein
VKFKSSEKVASWIWSASRGTYNHALRDIAALCMVPEKESPIEAQIRQANTILLTRLVLDFALPWYSTAGEPLDMVVARQIADKLIEFSTKNQKMVPSGRGT